ncbi:MAG: acyltransferase family protein [Pseudomonadales bacterium]
MLAANFAQLERPENYRADIDGLRGLAVAIVVLFHANSSWLSGGYIGVDVFFVVSGYLITGVILSDLERKKFEISGFLVRRLRRLYPALAAVLGLATIPGLFILLPEAAEDLGEGMATSAVFLSNFLYFTEDGYFEGPSKLKFYIHTWSLAIEEQFYLLFPLVLMVLHKRLRPYLLVAVLGLLAISLLISQTQVEAASRGAYFLLPSRAWELLVGASLALFVRDRKMAFATLMANCAFVVGMGLILASALVLTESTPFPGIYAFPACVGTALCILSGTQSSLSLPLKSGLLFGLGQISYSLYLWHWPVFVYRDYIFPMGDAVLPTIAAIALATVLATLSWRYIERPFRGAKGALTNRRFVALCGVSCASIVAMGLFLDQTNGFAGRIPDKIADKLDVANLASQTDRSCVGIDPERLSAESLCRLGVAGEPTFILWGDSHAASIAPVVNRIAIDRGISGYNGVAYGCAPLLGVDKVPFDPKRPCKTFNAAILDVIKAANISDVILFARWATHAEGSGFGHEGGRQTLLSAGNVTATNTRENRLVFKQAFSDTLRTLNELGIEPVILLSTPVPGFHVPQAFFVRSQLGMPFEPLAINQVAHSQRQAAVHAAIDALRGKYRFKAIATESLFCTDGTCATIIDDVPLYSDHNHLSISGTGKVTPAIIRALEMLQSAKGSKLSPRN